MHSELIHISPELAAEWLSKNTFNRTLSRRSMGTNDVRKALGMAA